ncbi:DNA-directed primase/polymerase protein-like [Prorops nasuta]|uniref:DNA-directed primase/polymerase protein-like n=1 Tax=Prorops nasuta TaxID=863751 RepID=UPI0034CD7408
MNICPQTLNGKGIKPLTFYGEAAVSEVAQQTFPKSPIRMKKHRKMPSHILEPPRLWREFNKQADAINFANEINNELDKFCVFVYQQINGFRKFVVAHPEFYWFHYIAKPDEEKCCYEVIVEGEPCWLYLDLEFLFDLNPNSNGMQMTKIFISICCLYMHKHWGLPCNLTDILNLDSSNEVKFSRHVIFSIKNVAFRDNFHVGAFVKTICSDILDYVASNQIDDNDILNHFSREDIESLFIETKKGKKLFVDTGVYTRNRHFRIYKSTKWGKQSHLKIALDCKHIPIQTDKDRELAIFLDSLVSYFPDKKETILVDFYTEETRYVKPFTNTLMKWKDLNRNAIPQYRELDEYIQSIVKPGKIRTCKYLEGGELILYEIMEYRYCQNIGRQHKSNNIYWIVDLNKKVMYQKCHDEECANFKSNPKRIPEEICFLLDKENDELLSSIADLEETDFLQSDLFLQI